MIDAKSSISERGIGYTIDDTHKRSMAAANKDKLELFIGKSIVKMEFAILTPSYYALDLSKTIQTKNKEICVWAYYHEPNKIKLIQPSSETVPIMRANGRTHSDEKLRQILLKTIEARMGALRSLQIMPTSHIFTKFEYLASVSSLFWDNNPKIKAH